MRFQLSALLFAASLLASAAASAEIVTITESVTSFGSVGGTQFTQQPATFVFTFVGDNSQIQNSSGVSYLTAISPVTVSVNGTTYDALDTIYAFVDPTDSVAGLADVTSQFNLYVESSNFTTYLFGSSIGPIISSADNVTGGAVELTNGSSQTANLNFFANNPPTTIDPVTYSSTVAGVSTTPEPSSLILLATGATGLIAAARRRLR